MLVAVVLVSVALVVEAEGWPSSLAGSKLHPCSPPLPKNKVLCLVEEVEADLVLKLAGSDDRAVLKELGWPFPRCAGW